MPCFQNLVVAIFGGCWYQYYHSPSVPLDSEGSVLVLTYYVSLGRVIEVEQLAILSSLHIQLPDQLVRCLLAADQLTFWQGPTWLLVFMTMGLCSPLAMRRGRGPVSLPLCIPGH